MPYEVCRTTAEHVLESVEAVLLSPDSADVPLVAAYLDTSADIAADALEMAAQLGFVTATGNGRYVAKQPLASYLAAADRHKKAAILRFALEQYPPFRTFRDRLAFADRTATAAQQTRALHSIKASKDIVAATLISLGTYARALESEGAGVVAPTKTEPGDFLLSVDEVVRERADVEIMLLRRLGEGAAAWIDREQVLRPLVDAYLKLKDASDDPLAPVQCAARAVEGFLTQLARHHSYTFASATGINGMADELAKQKMLTTKHKNMLKYLGHVRNAAEHGPDPETGSAWAISQTTCMEYVNVAMSVMTVLVRAINKEYFVRVLLGRLRLEQTSSHVSTGMQRKADLAGARLT